MRSSDGSSSPVDRDPQDRAGTSRAIAASAPSEHRGGGRPAGRGGPARNLANPARGCCYHRRSGAARCSCARPAGIVPAHRWIARAHSATTGFQTRCARGPEGPVFFALTPTKPELHHAAQVHAREDPQHRDHGPHRRRQDDDDRAHPLLHRPHLQDRRGPRGRRDDGLDGAGAGARHHDHVRRDHLRVGATTASTSSTRPATSTSPSRSSARCASSTARSRCSTRSPASSRSPRPSGARPTSTASRASPTSTRWTASARTSSRASRR